MAEDSAAANRPAPAPGGSGTTWAAVATQYVTADGERLAYRDLGPRGGVPVVLLTHLGANLDAWDPRVVDALARQHRVVAIELPGLGASSGATPVSVAAMARAARSAIAALGMDHIDLFGFSLGGFIAQQVALDAPHLVRRLVLAGTGPAGGKGINRATGAAYIYWDMLRARLARTDAREFLFFPRTPSGRAAAKDYLERLKERAAGRDAPVTITAFRRQIKAIRAWGRQAPQDLSRITAPTLIANGDHDRMVPTPLSADMHRRIPHSRLLVFPHAGHGGVFQYHEEFVAVLIDHLGG